jgi:hypothetical protein
MPFARTRQPPRPFRADLKPALNNVNSVDYGAGLFGVAGAAEVQLPVASRILVTSSSRSLRS